jgi:hypothetical protein
MQENSDSDDDDIPLANLFNTHNRLDIDKFCVFDVTVI